MGCCPEAIFLLFRSDRVEKRAMCDADLGMMFDVCALQER
jgi:hypothetical protein